MLNVEGDPSVSAHRRRRPRPVLEHTDSKPASKSSRESAHVGVVKESDWRELHTIMAGASRGEADINNARSILANWGVASFVDVQRSTTMLGQPYNLAPRDGYMPPVAVPIGRGEVLVGIDKAKPNH